MTVMLTEKGVKRVMREIKDLRSRTISERGFGLSFDERDMQTFFAIVKSPGGDFEGGEYLLRIKLPDTYPYQPPVICCETPNGRFEPGTNICLNISHFHSETWSPLLTLEKIILSVMSVFQDESVSGIGSIRTSAEEKKRLADQSSVFNRRVFPHVIGTEF